MVSYTARKPRPLSRRARTTHHKILACSRTIECPNLPRSVGGAGGKIPAGLSISSVVSTKEMDSHFFRFLVRGLLQPG